MGGLQDFSVSPIPLGTNWVIEVGWTLDRVRAGPRGFGDRACNLLKSLTTS